MFRIATVLIVAAAAATGACASRGAVGGPVPQPFPRPASSAAVPASGVPPTAVTGAPDGYAIAGTALSLRGVPYKNGGADPSGFDCSGFVRFVFAQHGIDVPRTVMDQSRTGHSVVAHALDAGDLVFFNTKGAGPTHVGIVIGGDEFVHAPSSNGEVRVERLGSSYWSSRLVDARRVTPLDAVPCGSAGVRSCL